MASLDVTSLFTNIPVQETIEIILNNVYNHGNLPPPSITRNTMKELLKYCTTESPFRSPNNKLYLQVNGVAMGSPLAPTFAEFYMCTVENTVLDDNNVKPAIYARYVDDMYVVVRDEEHLEQLRRKMEENSDLKFTYELNVNDKLPFLDIEIDGSGEDYITTVYRKPTDTGKCLNPAGECPDRYKISVIRAYLHRAHKTCSTPEILQSEINRTKQILINNGFTNSQVDCAVRKYNNNNIQTNDDHPKIDLFYENQMSNSYQTDERIIKQIIDRNVRSIDPNERINLMIYYKNRKTRNLIMKNNLNAQRGILQTTNVVYKISCPNEDCVLLNNINYIGMTTTTLSRRLTCHLGSGAPKDHMRQYHGETLTRHMLDDNVVILDRNIDVNRLGIAEALYIDRDRPAINIQSTGFERTLKLFNN
jgi:Ser-tRNA(Ala) deacylase AlaX